MGRGASISASLEIAAPAQRVWSMISDLPRMGEWSPENLGGEWVGTAAGPVPGAKFRGRNKSDRRSWTGLVVIKESEAPRRLVFAVKIGPLSGATWAYDIAALGGGCQVTETWIDTATPGLMTLGRFFTGIADRREFTRRSIHFTLAKLKEGAEAGG
jgi:uncharacterized protein YndB with AHSA1/START domain